jgi:hypothetical protein
MSFPIHVTHDPYLARFLLYEEAELAWGREMLALLQP